MRKRGDAKKKVPIVCQQESIHAQTPEIEITNATPTIWTSPWTAPPEDSSEGTEEMMTTTNGGIVETLESAFEWVAEVSEMTKYQDYYFG